jgi:uncharacterized iron-regulated membrane protein
MDIIFIELAFVAICVEIIAMLAAGYIVWRKKKINCSKE